MRCAARLDGLPLAVFGVESWPACGTPVEHFARTGWTAPRSPSASRRARPARWRDGRPCVARSARPAVDSPLLRHGDRRSLRARFGDRLVAGFVATARRWERRFGWRRGAGCSRTPAVERRATGEGAPPPRRLARPEIGYYPLAIRLNRRQGIPSQAHGARSRQLDARLRAQEGRFHGGTGNRAERWRPGTSDRCATSPALSASAWERECAALVLSNVRKPHAVVPFLVAARRLRIPIVAHVAAGTARSARASSLRSATSTSSRTARMEDDLATLPGIGSERVRVTGWPQTDVYSERRTREEFDGLVRSFGLDPSLPLVVVMGNTPTNAPSRIASSSVSSAGGTPKGAVASRSCFVRARATAPGASGSRPPSRRTACTDAGGELHRLRRPGDGSPARGLRRGQRRDDPARGDRQRPPPPSASYTTGSGAGEELGR